MSTRNYLSYLLNPLDLVRTKKILHVNPTAVATRPEPEQIKISVYDYDAQTIEAKEVLDVPSCFAYLQSPKVTWINVDGLRKKEVEQIGTYYGIHNLIIEDILSVGQRPKMDDINGLLFCSLSMLFFNAQYSSVETEQISIVMGKNFVHQLPGRCFKRCI